jgi:hypothetical protein
MNDEREVIWTDAHGCVEAALKNCFDLAPKTAKLITELLDRETNFTARRLAADLEEEAFMQKWSAS